MIILEWMKKNLILSIIIASILGVVVGGMVDVSGLKVLIIPLTILMVYPMMISLNYSLLKHHPNYKLIAVAVIINFLIYPVVSYFIGNLFFTDIYLKIGLFLITLLPTSGMTISWTVMAKGNTEEAIRLVIVSLLLGAILTPLYINWFYGASIAIPIGTVTNTILMVIIIPLVLGYLTQKVLTNKYGKETCQTKIKPKFPLVTTVAIVVMIFIAMSLRAKVLLKDPLIIIDILIPVLILYVVMYVIAYLGGRIFFKRNEKIVLTNATLVRNLSLALGLLLSVFPEASIAALMVALAYVVQVQFAAWNMKLADRIYGKQN